MLKTNIFSKIRRKEIRSYMRAYNRLYKTGNLSYVQLVKQELSKSLNPDLIHNDFHSCYNQFLITYLLNQEFTKALLISLNKNKHIKFSMPKVWRLTLQNKGFKADTFENKVRWNGYLLKNYVIGVGTFFFEIKRSLFKKNKINTPFVYFSQLSNNNLPKSQKTHYQNDIISWFVRKSEKPYTITHSALGDFVSDYQGSKIKFIDNPIPLIKGLKNWNRFLIWGIIYSFKSIFDERKTLLFRQAVLNQIVKITDSQQIASIYMFNNSSSIFRPLWTYEAEKRGASIIFYFYSLNNHIILEKNRKQEIFDFTWPHSTWPEFWFWNDEQRKSFEKIIYKNFKSKIVGVTPFESSRKMIIKKNTVKYLLIFDISPKPEYQYQLYGVNFDYYNTSFSIKFLETMDRMSKILNIKILYKCKRRVPSIYVNKQYEYYLKSLLSQENWSEVNPEYGINDLCENFNIVASIASPFTSTVFTTRKYNIPTIYYDASKKISSKQYFDRGVSIVSDEKSLLNWLRIAI